MSGSRRFEDSDCFEGRAARPAPTRPGVCATGSPVSPRDLLQHLIVLLAHGWAMRLSKRPDRPQGVTPLESRPLWAGAGYGNKRPRRAGLLEAAGQGFEP